MCRRLRSRSTSARDLVDTRWSSAIETGAFPSWRIPTMTRTHRRPLSKRMLKMNTVGVQVEVVDVLERPVSELLALLLPVGGDLGDDRRRQPNRRGEELLPSSSRGGT